MEKKKKRGSLALGENVVLCQPTSSVVTPAMTVTAITSAHRCLFRICENPTAANPTSSKSFMTLISRPLREQSACREIRPVKPGVLQPVVWLVWLTPDYLSSVAGTTRKKTPPHKNFTAGQPLSSPPRGCHPRSRSGCSCPRGTRIRRPGRRSVALEHWPSTSWTRCWGRRP